MSLVSIIIPARNEPYLQKTILDILKNARGEIEILAILDGYWSPAEEIVDDKRINYLHYSEAKGMRNAINMGIALAKGEYILKTDAHCSFAEGFDEVLRADMQPNWIVVPSRYPLDPEKWERETRTDDKYPVEQMYLSKDLHGEEWRERRDQEKGDIVDTMNSQGSCWFMKKDFYNELELLDENTYGIFWNEMQEIGLKCWLSRLGEMKVNRKTWYAHWHKTEGRGYNLPKEEQPKAQEAVKRWLSGQGWHKQKYSVSWLIGKFAPVPGWDYLGEIKL